MLKKTVVIVGGGFAGVRAALDLSRHKKDLKIIIVDKNGYHSYPADFYKLLSSSRAPTKHLTPAKFRLMFSSVSIPLAEIFEGIDSVEILIDEAESFDVEKNSVGLASGESVKYDWLVVSAGSVTNFYDIPGLKSRALEFKNTEDALNLRNAIDEVFERKAKHEDINIIVGGGGFTGIEVASELVGFLRVLAHTHGHPKENVSISVIEASTKILGPLSDWTREKTKKHLKKLGVKIILQSPVVDVRDNHAVLKNGSEVPFDVFVWTAGVKANSICKMISGAKLRGNLCMEVDEYLRLGISENVFAAGDMSFCKGFGDKPMPMTSQTAVSHGRFIAFYIKRKLHHRKVFKYHPRESRYIMPLGGRYAVADFGWLKLSGFLAWFLKRLVALKYFLSILPLGKALKVWWRGAPF